MIFDNWRQWLKQTFGAALPSRAPLQRSASFRFRPNLEHLEDRLAPATVSALIETSGPTTTNASSVTYTVIFSSATTGLSSGDLFLSGTAGVGTIGTPTPNGSDTQYTVPVTGLSGANGTIIMNLVSTGDLDNTVSNSLPVAGPTITLDSTAPSVVIGPPTGSTTTITYTVTYTDSQALTITLANANVTLHKTGTANATVAVTGTGTTSPATRTVTLSNITGAGNLSISIAADSASDAAGNQAPAVGPSATDTVVTVGITHASPTSLITSASSVTYTVAFSAATTGLTASNLALGGTAGVGTIGTPTTTDGGLQWSVPVTGLSGANGTLTLEMANATGLSTYLTTVLPYSGDTYTLSTTAGAPTITSAAVGFFTAGVTNYFQVTAVGTPTPTTYSLIGAPSWLHINASGLIYGTPPAIPVLTEAFGFTIDVGNGIAPDSTEAFTLYVVQPRRRGAG